MRAKIKFVDEMDPLYVLGLLLNPALGRVSERAKRGQTLEPWGLNPHRADPGTPMALDDEGGYDQKIPEGLTGVVLFPIMNATDALASIDLLASAAAKERPFKHHTVSFLSLCRTAIECSAQAIWVMSPFERETRRSRAAGLAKIGTEHPRDYHAEAIKSHDNRLQLLPDLTYQQATHRLQFHEDELAALDELSPANGRSYKELVRKSANWIGENPPKHTNETVQVHFPTVAKAQYRVCSSFTHGHSWATDLADGPSGMFSMMADAIATAILFTECAVCLFEAQSTDPASGRQNHYPERLQATIDEWRGRYSASDGDSPPESSPTE
ncbi:hypothetical protein P9209_25770 [Prescottella defluvii]|nr:hypothetical protein P9209_25770 [Prescottella defluvii]